MGGQRYPAEEVNQKVFSKAVALKARDKNSRKNEMTSEECELVWGYGEVTQRQRLLTGGKS